MYLLYRIFTPGEPRSIWSHRNGYMGKYMWLNSSSMFYNWVLEWGFVKSPGIISTARLRDVISKAVKTLHIARCNSHRSFHDSDLRKGFSIIILVFRLSLIIVVVLGIPRNCNINIMSSKFVTVVEITNVVEVRKNRDFKIRQPD
jgi:hypothetical protein